MKNRCNRHWPIFSLGLIWLVACGGPTGTTGNEAQSMANPPAMTPGEDVHSYANTQDYRVRHIDLDLSVDFDRKVVAGTADLYFGRVGDGNPPIVLDTRDLDIKSVQAGAGTDLASVGYALGEPSELLGTPLRIDLPPGAEHVVVEYETSPQALGLQWLEPAQTAGRRSPYLYSQAESIQARSFVPLQDTPGIRITYNATLRVPPGLRAVMGATNDPAAELDGVFEFEMTQPIPSYLIAIAVGDFDFRPLGPRSGVYAEAETLAAAAAEFEDTEAMLEAAEAGFGPYRWDRYDMLVLPPSFPLGGMENPRLSFVTPTLLAGDKSLVSTIAHELAHSWSGNLVTNATWRDLWLNEGFTTYLTYRIMQAIYGDERYELELALGYADLQSTLEELEDRAEVLAIDLRDRDPELVFTSIPYEKGALFLYELEQAVGRDAFDRFLLAYFDEFAFHSITTEDFLDYLGATLLAQYPDKLDAARIREWIFEPGLPEGAPAPTSGAIEALAATRAEWLAGSISARDIDTSTWTFHHWMLFLDGMPATLQRAQLEELDAAFDLTHVGNSEIASSWLRIAVRNQYEPAYDRLEEFLLSIGRYKLIGVLYRDMVTAGLADRAREIYARARPGYHPLISRRIDQLLADEQVPPSP